MSGSTDGAVLVASSGGASSDGAIRLASVFAHRRCLPLEVLAVLEPIAPYAMIAGMSADAQIDAERREATRRTIAAQCRRVVTGGGSDVVIEDGDIAGAIAARAITRGASLIAMGIGRHEPIDRLLGVELAIAVLRRTLVPVLAVTPRSIAPLRSILIATDFSAAAERAARLALSLAAHDATIHVVHIWPEMSATRASAQPWSTIYQRGARALIDELLTSLPLPPKGRAVVHLRSGHASTVIRDIANDHWVDLISLGSHASTAFRRLTLGNVPEDVLRTARCSLLIAPPRADENT